MPGGPVAAFKAERATLFDVPVSNHGARVRFILYKKQLEGEVDIVPPTQLGGLKSDEYLALNPEGKMPLLVLPSGPALYESEVISQYIIDKYRGRGEQFEASTPEARALSNLITRVHDQYITPLQGCMYKPMSIEQRAEQLKQLVHQLDVLERLVQGPYAAGEVLTGADATLLPTFVFFTFILTRIFGWADVFSGRPNLGQWWSHMQQDSEARRIISEVGGALEQGWLIKARRWEELGILDQVKDTRFQWSY